MVFETLLPRSLVEPLGWTLLHFLWQGAVVAILLAGALTLLRRATANARYLAGCVALLLIAACPVITFSQTAQLATSPANLAQQNRVGTSAVRHAFDLVVDSESDTAGPGREEATLVPQAASSNNNTARPAPARAIVRPISGRVSPLLPAFVAIWVLGVAVLSLRLVGGWLVLERMRRRHTCPVPAALHDAFGRLARRLGVTRPMRVVESAWVGVPAVVGWLRPTILMPASAITGLSSEQVEAILAHELAHIRRHDYLVNLFQTVVETLLFYHPAVWWVSRRIRMEREHCCDDLAVAACGNRLLYARALTALEESRARIPQLAVAASGSLLLRRIRRLLQIPPQPSHGAGRLLVGATGLAIVACLIIGLRFAAHASEPQKQTAATAVENRAVAASRQALLDNQAVGHTEPLPEEVVAVLGDSRFSHWYLQRDFAISTNGRLLATASRDHTAIVWDLEDGRKLHEFIHSDGVCCVAFSPDSKTLVTEAMVHTQDESYGQLMLWDLTTGQLRWTIEDKRMGISLAFSPDGQTIAVHNSSYIELRDAHTGAIAKKISFLSEGWYGRYFIESLAFSPDGTALAAAGLEPVSKQASRSANPSTVGVVKIWDVASGALRHSMRGHLDSVTSVAFSPDSATVVSGSRDGTVRLWDAATGTEKKTLLGHNYHVESVAFSPDGKLLASGALDQLTEQEWEGIVKIWDAATGEELRTIRGLIGGAERLNFTPDGSTLATLSQDRRVRFWDAVTGRETGPLPEDHGGLHRAEFSPDGRTLATGSVDGTVQLWDVGTWTVRNTFTGHKGYVRSVSYSPDGGTLATAGQDGSIILWDVSTGTIERKWNAHGWRVWCLRYSPDGRTLASAGGDYTIKLWDAANGTLRKTIQGLSKTSQGYNIMVRSLAFSNDGATLAAGEGWHVRLWDVESGELRDTFQQPGNSPCVAFSPNGATLAVGSRNEKIHHKGGRDIRESLDGTIILWDPSTGEQRDSLNVHSGPYINSVAYSPDGRTLASTGEDGRICFSDPQTGTLRRSLKLGPPGGRISRLAYSPDGRYLASVNRNGTVYILQPDAEED